MTATTPRRERLRFLEFDFQRLPSSRCQCRVVLERHQGERFVGSATGLGSQAGELRCCAEAAADALAQAVDRKMEFELLGVKAVRAFDASVVIVSISCHNSIPATRLVGSCLSEQEVHRCAALAVLNATNRMLGNIIFTR